MGFLSAIATVRTLANDRAAERLEQRIAGMDSRVLAEWAETAVMAIGADLTRWRQDGDVTGLYEAHLNTAQLLHALEDLHRRVDKR